MAGGIPFQERKSKLRAVMDLATGAYPSFLFGGRLGAILPVFHFHDLDRAYLEPYFAYLKANGYRTVTSEAMAKVARGEMAAEPGMVALCFDDAWTSFWSVVAPLLEAYEFTAIVYVAPGRIAEADGCRPVGECIDDGPPFATWPELVALGQSGRVDIQGHTQSHAMIACDARPAGFVSPQTELPLLSWPQVGQGAQARFLSGDMLGHPLFPQRSRMSDAHRFLLNEGVSERCCRHVASHGAEQFFAKPDWQAELEQVMGNEPGRFETDAERDESIRRELVMCREVLEARLGKPISQICMPWAVCGARAETLAREVGYASVVADALWGKRYVHPGANPYRLMRLKHQYIFCLPGAGRRTLMALRKGGVHG